MNRMTRRAALGAIPAGLALPRVGLAISGEDAMRLRCRFADQDFTYVLDNHATTRDLVSMLPLELVIEDFSTNEKIAHLPRRLDEGGHVAFDDEAPGDLCYFLGWGNLAFFHDDYRYRGDLIRLGRIEGGLAPLLVRGTHPLRLTLQS
ncbi:hypothetical protein FHS00_002691 [Limimaricola variabilis]|uniref:Cyclophilin-like domain-containing protein n=1 Tax=Limimaricola variabilis TaxID=1492771 RepID=A0ABR6HRN7_9RHOB|nr:cyclophilin-like fold protein [Limimaricola variabilis]MBB3713090.1 hypothetical protein [Limimaricola variabilis]